MKLTKSTIIILIGILLFSLAFVYAVTTLRIPSTGTIATNTSTLTASPNTINWGDTLQPRQVITKQVTLTNTASTSTSSLNMSATPTVGTIIWNQGGNIIAAGASLNASFTLTVSDNPPQGAFNFDITITG